MGERRAQIWWGEADRYAVMTNSKLGRAQFNGVMGQKIWWGEAPERPEIVCRAKGDPTQNRGKGL